MSSQQTFQGFPQVAPTYQSWKQNPEYIEACRTKRLPGDPTAYTPAHPRGATSTDVTSFKVGMAKWNFNNLPDIMYQLWPCDVWKAFKRSPKPRPRLDPQGNPILERYPRPNTTPRTILDFPILRGIDKISTEVPWWFLETLFRLEPRLEWKDIDMLMEYVGGRARQEDRSKYINGWNNAMARGRDMFRMVSWREKSKVEKANKARDHVLAALTQDQRDANTTRGLTPGPDLLGNVVPLPAGHGRRAPRRKVSSQPAKKIAADSSKKFRHTDTEDEEEEGDFDGEDEEDEGPALPKHLRPKSRRSNAHKYILEDDSDNSAGSEYGAEIARLHRYNGEQIDQERILRPVTSNWQPKKRSLDPEPRCSEGSEYDAEIARWHECNGQQNDREQILRRVASNLQPKKRSMDPGLETQPAKRQRIHNENEYVPLGDSLQSSVSSSTYFDENNTTESQRQPRHFKERNHRLGRQPTQAATAAANVSRGNMLPPRAPQVINPFSRDRYPIEHDYMESKYDNGTRYHSSDVRALDQSRRGSANDHGSFTSWSHEMMGTANDRSGRQSPTNNLQSQSRFSLSNDARSNGFAHPAGSSRASVSSNTTSAPQRPASNHGVSAGRRTSTAPATTSSSVQSSSLPSNNSINSHRQNSQPATQPASLNPPPPPSPEHINPVAIETPHPRGQILLTIPIPEVPGYGTIEPTRETNTERLQLDLSPWPAHPGDWDKEWKAFVDFHGAEPLLKAHDPDRKL